LRVLDAKGGGEYADRCGDGDGDGETLRCDVRLNAERRTCNTSSNDEPNGVRATRTEYDDRPPWDTILSDRDEPR
jgi:hypothetical protein